MGIRKNTGTALVKAVMTYLNTVRRIPAFRMNTGAAKVGGRFVRFGTPGMSDVVGLVPGEMFIPPQARAVFLAVEVKDGGRLTDLQRAFLDLVNAAGGIGFCCSSVAECGRCLDAALAALEADA